MLLQRFSYHPCVVSPTPQRHLRCGVVRWTIPCVYLCFLTLSAFGANDLPTESPPSFAVRTAQGVLRTYDLRNTTQVPYSVNDDILTATLVNMGDSMWELVITNKSAPLREVWFPRDPEPIALNGNIDDDYIYYPFLMGTIELARYTEPNEWWGVDYPGDAFAPLIVVADRTKGRIVAAVNWPPRRVTPVYARGRLALRYSATVAPGTTEHYHALAANVSADPTVGRYAWHAALDSYASWLNRHMRAAGLIPINYPDKLWRVHGWLNVPLHHIPHFRVRELRALYARYHEVFPWLQMWGQMSNYHRNPRAGRSASPFPPLKAGERTGCCLPNTQMHPRYLPDLPTLAREITSSGGLVGYYERPPPPYGRLDIPGSHHLQFLLGWISANRARGANAYYVDVLGAEYFGEPLQVARLFQTVLPRMTVIEYPVDLYPTAFLISGSLRGYIRCSTTPGQTLASLDRGTPRMTFPRFGRYLLPDRIMFLGFSNGDFVGWDNFRGYEYWTERQVFLLGAKFDAPTLLKGHRGWINPLNPIVRTIVHERDRVRWWERRPTYRDVAGLSRIPPGIDVRRFVDRSNVSLFVIDNWHRLRGRSFQYRGHVIPVPPVPLAIIPFDAEHDVVP